MTRPQHSGSSSAVADWSLIAVPGVIWGASFLFIAEGLNALAPMGVTLVRVAVGFAALGCFRAAWKPVERADWPKIALLSFVWMAFPLAMFPFAEQHISSAIAGMLNGAVPVFATIVAAFIAKALPSRGVLMGLAIGIVGIVLMAIPDLGNPSSAGAIAMVAVACVAYGFAPNLARPLQQKYGSLPVIWRAQAVGIVLLAPFGVRDVTQARWSLWPVLSLLALGALGTGVAHVVMATAAGRIGAAKASASAFLIPPVALVLGVLVRHEQVAFMAVIGGALCVAGAWVMRRASMPAGVTAANAIKAAAVALMLASPAALRAQASVQEVVPLARLSGPIVVDGRSDDAAWQAVAPLPMTVHLPNFGGPPSERTVLRVAYDTDALYVMVDAYEAHPGGVRASSMIRDDDAPGDFINVLLDTFGDRQNALNFSTTPGGQRNDWSLGNDAQSFANASPAWNGVWDLAVRRSAEGWHAEYRIPFSTLRFNTDNGRVEFGMTVNRLVAHSNERQTYPVIEPVSGMAVWKPSRYQRVSIEGIAPVRSVRFIPYVTAGAEGVRTPDPALSPWARRNRAEVGGDLKVAVSQTLTLDLTANTDFAESEVDDQRINLTRFPLLFPEQRAFFVERAGTFEVRTGETDYLFNSRRVGLTPDGRPVRLLGGARLVGQVRGWDIGLFDAQTDASATTPRENLGVARLRRGVLNERSWVGAMLTSRLAEDSSQQVLAVDGDINLGHDDYVSFGVATTAGDAMPGAAKGILPRGAIRLLVERRRNRGFWYRAGTSTTGAQYAPALGYVERLDAIRPMLELGYGRQVTAAGDVVRVNAVGNGQYRNAAGTFEGAVVDAMLQLERPSGATWSLMAVRQDDDLIAPFSPTPATTVPVGWHAANYVEAEFSPSTGPRLALGAHVRTGQYFDGTLHSVTLSPEWRASAHLRVTGGWQLNRVEFRDRDERKWSNLARVRVLAAASPRLMLSATVQSNSLAKAAMANVRLRYHASEGNDLWLVYGHVDNLDRDRYAPLAPRVARSQLLLKVTHGFGR